MNNKIRNMATDTAIFYKINVTQKANRLSKIVIAQKKGKTLGRIISSCLIILFTFFLFSFIGILHSIMSRNWFAYFYVFLLFASFVTLIISISLKMGNAFSFKGTCIKQLENKLNYTKLTILLFQNRKPTLNQLKYLEKCLYEKMNAKKKNRNAFFTFILITLNLLAFYWQPYITKLPLIPVPTFILETGVGVVFIAAIYFLGYSPNARFSNLDDAVIPEIKYYQILLNALQLCIFNESSQNSK